MELKTKVLAGVLFMSPAAMASEMAAEAYKLNVQKVFTRTVEMRLSHTMQPYQLKEVYAEVEFGNACMKAAVTDHYAVRLEGGVSANDDSYVLAATSERDHYCPLVYAPVRSFLKVSEIYSEDNRKDQGIVMVNGVRAIDVQGDIAGFEIAQEHVLVSFDGVFVQRSTTDGDTPIIEVMVEGVASNPCMVPRADESVAIPSWENHDGRDVLSYTLGIKEGRICTLEYNPTPFILKVAEVMDAQDAELNIAVNGINAP